MKTIPPTCPEPEFGRKYWRSLDQLADTPEFNQWLEREFPAGASEWTDPVSRRHFVKIMSASFLLGGLGLASTGCRRPEQKIEPFGKMPENYLHGVPQYYATAMPTRTGAVPLLAKAYDGRPIKVEGNGSHPDSNGGTDRFAQASILNLYDPDRSTTFTKGGSVVDAVTVHDYLSGLSKSAQASQGKGLCFLRESSNSPSRDRLHKLINEKLPQARWFTHDSIDLDVHRKAASAAFGKSVRPQYRFDAASVIVSLDCDFIGSEDDAHNHIRRFTAKRRMTQPEDALNRLYVVEGLYTLTGFNADHRLRVATGAVQSVAAALAGQTGAGGVDVAAKATGVDPKWITACAEDLKANRGQSLVVAGYRQPLAVHLLAHAMNVALGNVGKTVVLQDVPDFKEGTLADLAGALNAGEVETLVVLGGNPVLTAPADLNWSAAQRKAKSVIRLGYYQDETSQFCDYHIPAAHYLESWGDARTTDGTVVAVQPLIAPLFGGVTEIEVLARIAGATAMAPYEVVRETFAALVNSKDIEGDWRKFLFNGFLPDSAAAGVEARFDGSAVAKALGNKQAAAPSANSLEVVFYRDYSVDDGRYGNNGWLQELPDPITKMVWDNAVLISRKTAAELGVENMQVVEVKIGSRAVRGPIWIQPGLADYTLGLGLGYGRQNSGRVGNGVGFNAYPLRVSTAEYIASGASLQKTSETYTIACTQDHWSMEGRPIIREANLEQYRGRPDFAQEMKMEEPPVVAPLYPNPFDEAKKAGRHQWGMSIDLNLCVGCSACMMACQSENNVPIVGKDQVRRGREMHWLRIDRYYAGAPRLHKFIETFKAEEKQQHAEWIDDPQVVTQPMMCQHCESAPCENVCPVNATVHDQEGLNLMVYNRCVGTRYCSNNCPYKVRKFNYFDYNKRGIGKNLYYGPLKERKNDEWDLLKMIKNPDVTVRMRGVMEKCTFCVQRIEQAKIAQKVKAGPTGDVVVPTDSFTTACAQACPAGAIVFGNIGDPSSHVSKLKAQPRNYSVLEFLLTKPRLTYLAKIRNPNKAMPDFYEAPLTLQEFKVKNRDPFSEESAHEGGEHGAHAVKGEK